MNTPDIRVEKGHAEPEEVAAITAILLARAAAAPPQPRPTGAARRPAGAAWSASPASAPRTAGTELPRKGPLHTGGGPFACAWTAGEGPSSGAGPVLAQFPAPLKAGARATPAFRGAGNCASNHGMPALDDNRPC